MSSSTVTVRARHLQRSRHLPRRPTCGHRRHHDRRSRYRLEAWLYLSARRYRYLLKIVEKAVADAYAKGFLGKNIFGKEGVDFDIVTQTGAGAYEVGEESALMESLEGKRGVPRIKPPFPAVVGLYGGPTVINNAETIASAPHILLMGGEGLCEAWQRTQRRHASIWHQRPR